MSGAGKGGGEPGLTSIIPTAAGVAVIPTAVGVAVLPNTGANTLVFIAALVSTIVGAAILLTTAARFVAKKAYKA